MTQEERWPPSDAQAYVQSDEFGSLLVELAAAMSESYPNLDFVDAVARAFVWFDMRVKTDPGFISRSRFPTAKRFEYYLRRCLRNDAKRTHRDEVTRKKYEHGHHPRERGVELTDPASHTAVLDATETLPEPHRSVVVDLVLGESEAEEMALTLGVDNAKLGKLIEEAIDMLAEDRR